MSWKHFLQYSTVVESKAHSGIECLVSSSEENAGPQVAHVRKSQSRAITMQRNPPIVNREASHCSPTRGRGTVIFSVMMSPLLLLQCLFLAWFLEIALWGPVLQFVRLSQRENANFETLQIGLAAGCWVWDYLRRSYQAGLFLPLSGGIDSCATAVIVFSMTRLVYAAMVDSNKQVIEDARRICGEPKDSKWMPSKPEELCNRIFHTWFAMATVFS